MLMICIAFFFPEVICIVHCRVLWGCHMMGWFTLNYCKRRLNIIIGHCILNTEVFYLAVLVPAVKMVSDSLVSLEMTCLQMTVTSKYAIIVLCGVSLSIYCDGNSFYLFDRHARNSTGACCPDGASVVGSIHLVRNWSNLLRVFVQSFGQNADEVQFDIHAISIVGYCKSQSQFGIEILDSLPGFKIIQSKRKKNHDAS